MRSKNIFYFPRKSWRLKPSNLKVHHIISNLVVLRGTPGLVSVEKYSVDPGIYVFNGKVFISSFSLPLGGTVKIYGDKQRPEKIIVDDALPILVFGFDSLSAKMGQKKIEIPFRGEVFLEEPSVDVLELDFLPTELYGEIIFEGVFTT